MNGKAIHAAHFLFGVKGRLNRAGYWIFVIAGVYYVYISVAVIAGGWRNLLGGLDIYRYAPDLIESRGLVVAIVFLTPLVAAYFCIVIRRLHDLNRTGLWSILYVLGPFAFMYLATLALQGAASGYPGDPSFIVPGVVIPVLLQFLAAATWIWGFIELGCLRGTVGANNYGPDPIVRPLPWANAAEAPASEPAGHDLRASPAAAEHTCSNCGAGVAAGARFCNRCGHTLAA